MAIADLTINYQREEVVDFTMPFLDLGKCTASAPVLKTRFLILRTVIL